MFKNYKIFFIVFLIIFIISFSINSYSAVSSTVDVDYELISTEIFNQNQFVLFAFYPFTGNTDFWLNDIKPVFDTYMVQYSGLHIGYTAQYDHITYKLYFYDQANYTASGTTAFETYAGETVQLKSRTFPSVLYTIDYTYSTNSGSHTITNTSFTNYICRMGVKSDLLIEFCQLIDSGTNDYTQILTSINNYLSSINTVNNDILTSLSNITSALANISSNTSTDYSQAISSINSKISDILSDNDTIISQNAEMIDQQEQINENIENVNDSIQDLKDTITDDTVETTADDLPSIDVSDPSETGIDNIFQSIYNAFCTGEAQDIVFPIPFTNKNITLSPYYVRDMLNNNGAGWVYTLIQAFWGYLIGRYVVKDISRKITKVKSGNIENIENENIKEEML